MTLDPKGPRKETGTPQAPNWRDLAEAAATEQDPIKVLERAKELIRALDAESQERMEHLAEREHCDKAAS